MLDELLDLARRDPARLLGLVRDPATPPLARSYALEALGTLGEPDAALPLLFAALDDADARAREGAVLGLASYLDLPSVREWLEKVAATDADADVRAAAALAL